MDCTVLYCILSPQGPVLPSSRDGAVWVCEKCGAKFSGNSINKVSSFKGLSNYDVGLVLFLDLPAGYDFGAGDPISRLLTVG